MNVRIVEPHWLKIKKRAIAQNVKQKERKRGLKEMKYRIHFRHAIEEDSAIITGETIEEIKEKAFDFVESRGIDMSTCWSEKIED